MVFHVHGFGLTLDYGVISNTNFSVVITMDGIFGLRPTLLGKGLTNLYHGFSTDEEASNFSFGSRGHENHDTFGDGKDRAVYGRDRVVLREHDVGTSVDAGMSDIKIGSI